MNESLAGALAAIAKGFAWLGAATALAVAVLTVVSVVGRAVFAQPISGDVELCQFGIALAISLCLPWCQLRGANIIVDFFTQRLTARAQRRLDGLGAWLLAAMYAVLSWRSAVGAAAVASAGETSMIRSMPMWWVYAALAPGLAVAALIAALQGLRLLAGRDLGVLIAGDDAREPAQPAVR